MSKKQSTKTKIRQQQQRKENLQHKEILVGKFEKYEQGDEIALDGSILEGGGQIIRNTCALSALLQVPITISKIRQGRSQPGLRPQHMTGAQLVNTLYPGLMVGAEVNSQKLVYRPGPICQETFFEADTKTAGSITLLIQILLPCVCFRPVPTTFLLKGGTNAAFAPQLDYLLMVFQPISRLFGINFSIDVTRRGFYPRGGGEVRIEVNKGKEIPLNGINLIDQGKVNKIICRVIISNLPAHIPERISKAARASLRKYFPDVSYEEEFIREEHAPDTAATVVIVAHTTTNCILAGSCIGERGKASEVVGEEAAEMLINNYIHAQCVDEYLQDQLIIFMALASGTSQIRTGPITLHTETAIHFSTLLTGAKFEIVRLSSPNQNIIKCTGIAFNPTTSTPTPTPTTTTTSTSTTTTTTPST